MNENTLSGYEPHTNTVVLAKLAQRVTISMSHTLIQ